MSEIQSKIQVVIANEKEVLDTQKQITKENEKQEKVTKETAKNTANIYKNLTSMLKNSEIVGWVGTIKNVTNSLIKAVQPQAEFIENLNMMEVAFGKSKDAAQDYIKTVSEVTGFDAASLTRQLGIFRQIAGATGMASEGADLLSTNLSKLSLDIASLYNVDVQRAGKALESAITGQVRSIRSLTGADITQATLQQEAYRLGIEKSVTQMNRAEKSILIYLSLERQLADANGDMARTFNSVANQTKVFKDQITTLVRNIGGLLLPILRTILPYLNGILMAINSIIGAILSLFKIDAKSLSSEFGIASAGLDNIEDGFNRISTASEKAKKGLRGFDKLNNITSPSKDSASAGLGGVDKDLYEYFKEYNLQLDKINSKAKEIRDKLLNWLGFTLNEDGSIKKFELKLGTIIGGLAIGGIVYKGVKGIFGIVKGIGSLLTGGKVGKGLDKVKETLGFSTSGKGFNVPSPKTILKGLADLALIIGGVELIVEAIGLLNRIPGWEDNLTSGLKTIKDIFKTFGEVFIELAAMTAGVILIGNIPITTVLTGIANLALIIVGFEAVVAAVGAIAQIPYFTELINTGGEVLISLAKILGGFAGAIVNGFLNVATESFGSIGKHLAEFAENATPFFTTFANLPSEMFDNITQFTLTVGLLTATSFIEGIQSWIGLGIDDFGKDLVKFSKYFVDYSENMKGVKTSIVKNTSEAVESVVKWANAAPKFNGLKSIWNGTVNLPKFGNQLKEFAPNFKTYADNISGIPVDTVISTSSAVQSVMDWANAAPTFSEWKKLISGQIDLAKVGHQLNEFAPLFAAYSIAMKDVQIDVVSKTNDAVTSVMDWVSSSPNFGGFWQSFTGEKNLSYLGYQLADFGKYYWQYYKYIKEVDSSVISKNNNSIKVITDIANNIPREDGFWDWLIGDDSLGTFGEVLEEFGKSFKRYFNSIKDINFTTIQNSIKSLKGLVDEAIRIKNNGVAGTLGQVNLSSDSKKTNNNTIQFSSLSGAYQKADGGFVGTGQLFVAREAGPEMVGTIGGHTAVANNDQIVESISIGVAKAMAATQKDTTVNITAKGDTSGLLDFITFEQNKKNRQYGLG